MCVVVSLTHLSYTYPFAEGKDSSDANGNHYYVCLSDFRLYLTVQYSSGIHHGVQQLSHTEIELYDCQ